jgi:ferredoxin
MTWHVQGEAIEVTAKEGQTLLEVAHENDIELEGLCVCVCVCLCIDVCIFMLRTGGWRNTGMSILVYICVCASALI